jgi:hypothetical protein
MRNGRVVTGGMMTGGVLVGGAALVVLVMGLLIRLPVNVLLVAVAVSTVAGGMVARRSAGGGRRDTLRWQEAAVVVSAWAARHAGQSETSRAAFAAGWTLTASPRFAGAVLAVGRLDGFEVGVTCYTRSEGHAGPTRHTGVLVRLRNPHPPVHARRRCAEPVASRLADLTDLAGRVELVEIEDRELRISYQGWPAAVDLDACVEGAVDVARALG